MGFMETLHHQIDGGDAESESAKNWVIAGIIPFRSSPLKPDFTKPAPEKEKELIVVKDEYDAEECCTTPTSEESRIPTGLPCPPPPPRKRRSSSRCQHNSNNNTVTPDQFFTPPDLETVFMRRPLVDNKS